MKKEFEFNHQVPSKENISFESNRMHADRSVPELIIFEQPEFQHSTTQKISPRLNNNKSSNSRMIQKIKIQQYLDRYKKQEQQAKLKNNRQTFPVDRLEDLQQGNLRDQLCYIDEELNKHREAQKFMIAFSINPQQAIQQLIDKGEIEDSPKGIAEYLVQLVAINKGSLGQYFAKNNSKILDVLRQFCRLLKFDNLEFDKALRALLSKFKLPGQSQQIQRILDVFSQVYYQTHSQEFTDSTQIFVLSYSLIMLATDAHNPKQQTKMTKQQFIKNTSPVCPKIPKQYLSGMYDRIVKQEFQTHATYLEQIYDRLNKLKINISQIAKVMKGTVELIEGHIFIKYCKNTVKSVMRKIYLSQAEDRLLWEDPNKPFKAPRFLQLKDIIDLNLGSNSPVMILNKVPKQFDSMCFSIVTKHRTLDLKARDADHRAKWVNYLGALLIKKREDLKEQRQNYYKSIFNKEKIQQIWNTDIFPHWDNHWDYKLKRPKVKKYENVLKVLRLFCCCNNNKDQVYQVQEGQYQNFLPIKTPLLLTLWKYGLPETSRKTLWPIVIGNDLGITQKLYQIYKKKKKEIHQIHKMPYSMEAINVVQLLAVIRPDIGLVRNLLEMSQVFLKYLNQYESLCSLANMMHHYHFLSFYQGEKQQIDFRFKFFEYLLQRHALLVMEHFRGLEVTPRLYLVKWFLSIFSNCFEEGFLARIWDNFFLEGQIYLFKVGIAIIKYYEIELKMSTFDDVIRLLSRPKDTSEVLFFEILGQLQITNEEFEDFIEKRKYAKIKTKVQQIPLE